MGADPQLEIVRSPNMPAQPSLDGAAFQRELTAFVSGFDAIQTAELLVTAIVVPREPSARVRTPVRYDLVGTSATGRAAASGRVSTLYAIQRATPVLKCRKRT